MNQSLLAELDQVMPNAVQTGLFASLASFYDRPGGDTPTVNSIGQPDLTTLVPVTGLQNIPCMIAPWRIVSPDKGGGGRLPEHFEETSERHILLNDYYPQILQRYVVVVDGSVVAGALASGVAYEITPGAVENDSQRQMTRLAVREYSL